MGETAAGLSAVFMAVVGQVFETIGDVASTIISTPVLLIPVALAFSGGAIGLAKGLMGTRRRKR